MAWVLKPILLQGHCHTLPVFARCVYKPIYRCKSGFPWITLCQAVSGFDSRFCSPECDNDPAAQGFPM